VLHVGHALNNTMQDILTRYHRMCGDNTLWVPGTDHAGIATQNVVERQLAGEGKSRHDLGRDVYRTGLGVAPGKGRHHHQPAQATRLLLRLEPGAVYHGRGAVAGGSRGLRPAVQGRADLQGRLYRQLVPRCHTALADDEVEHEDPRASSTISAIRYADGSGYVVVATTRPETMLGDTGVAVHPDDDRYRHGRQTGIELPLTGRTIPVVFDEHVQMDFGTGALKVTPSHDRDDYEIGRRHNLAMSRSWTTSGVMNEAAGSYAGLDRFACRKQIVADLESRGYLEKVEDYPHAVGQCYRCKTVIEPTTSLQWFVSVRPLADKAVAAVREERIRIYPKTWYNTFYSWMDNIRDWCISRQIWWGHRIPAWTCRTAAS
jgi:valyl-tRNA synthetase